MGKERYGTPAASMDGQVPVATRHERVRILSAKQNEIRRSILEESLASAPRKTVLFEDYKTGFAYGHTDNFIQVRVPAPRAMHSIFAEVDAETVDENGLVGRLV